MRHTPGKYSKSLEKTAKCYISVKKLRRFNNSLYICSGILKIIAMLIKFSVKNFRGFADRIEWDLSQPSNYEFNTYVIKDGVIKNGIVYGPNGSGKSNFALAIFDIENHLSAKWKKTDYYANFAYTGNPNSPVEFEYVFKFDNDILPSHHIIRPGTDGGEQLPAILLHHPLQLLAPLRRAETAAHHKPLPLQHV